MKPKDFRPARRIELQFQSSINQLLAKYLNFAEDETPGFVLRALSNLATNNVVLEDMALHIAKRMVTQIRVSNAKSWRAAAAQSSRGREIYRLLQTEMRTGVGQRVNGLVEENAMLIRSIPGDLREMVNNEIAEWSRQGLRPETIAKNLRRRLPQLTRHKAALIARTETGKASEALTRARSEDIGVSWYQWSTVEDGRVRSSHRLMDKVLVAWNDPPSPEALAHVHSTLGRYNAGSAPNCRCTAFPLISLDQVSWPCRVYRSGSIDRMTRGQFRGLLGQAAA